MKICATNPDLSEAALIHEISKFVAPPTLAPHSTGGAVDVTLIELASGQEREMGSPFNGNPVSTKGATYTNTTNISPAAKANRQILIQAMSKAGFVNYPTEWWHWSFGDCYWALLSEAPAAIYGSIED